MSIPPCDAEYTKILQDIGTRIREAEPLCIDDATGHRAMIAKRFAIMKPPFYDVQDVVLKEYSLPLPDGHAILICYFQPLQPSPSDAQIPAAFYLHGGGMTMGSTLDSRILLAWNATVAKIQISSVEYRLAPEHPHPAPVEDCYASLKWLYREATTFNIDVSRIALMGESAGGGLAAAVTLLARDREEISPPLAKQILIQPMLDGRNTTPRLLSTDRFMDI